jgi:hypothetical protein
MQIFLRGKWSATHTIKTLLQEDKLRAFQSTSKINGPKDEDGENTSKPAHHDLKAPPPIKSITQTKD